MIRPHAKTAAAYLKATSEAIEKQLAELAAKLKAHKAKADAHPSNWGYAGDLRKVESDLADILNFIN